LLTLSSHLFLGRASQQVGKPDDAAKAYKDATKIKPNDTQAWLGLQALYDAQGPSKLDEFVDVSLRLAEIYAEL
jgi:cytochrome c-type biogenesis protein CcmH/NrfG